MNKREFALSLKERFVGSVGFVASSISIAACAAGIALSLGEAANAQTIHSSSGQSIPRGIHKINRGGGHESAAKKKESFGPATNLEKTDKLAELINRCSACIADDPSLLKQYVSRALLRVASSDVNGASEDALHVLNSSAAKPEVKTLAAIVLYLAHMRNNDAEKAKVVLNEASSQLDHNVWPYAVIKLLRGESDTATLFKQNIRLQEVQAHTFVAYDHLFKGNKPQAKKEFDWLERNVVDADDIYHQIGFAELKRMDPSHTFRTPDYNTYMSALQDRIKRMWYPPKGEETRRVVAVFKVHSDGKASHIKLTDTSGTATADAAAVAAVERAAPFQPLPAGSPDDVDVEFTFDYNVWKDGQLVRGKGDSTEAAQPREDAASDEDEPSKAPTRAPSPTASAGSSGGSPAGVSGASSSKKSLPSGYSTYANARYGFSIAYPQQLLKPQDESDNSDGRIFVSSDNNAELRSYGCHAIKADGSTQSVFEEYNDALEEYSPKNNAVVTYKKLGANWFVISGVRNNKVFYRKTLGKRGDFMTFIIEYPVSMKSTYDAVTENVATFFVANPNSQF